MELEAYSDDRIVTVLAWPAQRRRYLQGELDSDEELEGSGRRAAAKLGVWP